MARCPGEISPRPLQRFGRWKVVSWTPARMAVARRTGDERIWRQGSFVGGEDRVRPLDEPTGGRAGVLCRVIADRCCGGDLDDLLLRLRRSWCGATTVVASRQLARRSHAAGCGPAPAEGGIVHRVATTGRLVGIPRLARGGDRRALAAEFVHDVGPGVARHRLRLPAAGGSWREGDLSPPEVAARVEADGALTACPATARRAPRVT